MGWINMRWGVLQVPYASTSLSHEVVLALDNVVEQICVSLFPTQLTKEAIHGSMPWSNASIDENSTLMDNECNDVDWSYVSHSSTRTRRRYPKFWNTQSSYQEHFKGYKCRGKQSSNIERKEPEAKTRGQN